MLASPRIEKIDQISFAVVLHYYHQQESGDMVLVWGMYRQNNSFVDNWLKADHSKQKKREPVSYQQRNTEKSMEAA